LCIHPRGHSGHRVILGKRECTSGCWLRLVSPRMLGSRFTTGISSHCTTLIILYVISNRCREKRKKTRETVGSRIGQWRRTWRKCLRRPFHKADWRKILRLPARHKYSMFYRQYIAGGRMGRGYPGWTGRVWTSPDFANVCVRIDNLIIL